MKGRTDKDMVKVFQDIYRYLRDQNLTPALHVMDNEYSKAIKNFTEKENVDIQLVKPHNHRVNAAEPAVKAEKYHTIAGLATVDITCPLRLWCKFVPQIQDTMNMVSTQGATAASPPTKIWRVHSIGIEHHLPPLEARRWSS